MPAGYTGVDFANTLSLDESFDVFRYRNYYNGGGVALGDVNNDGLTDIYLTANMLPNRLFLNQGNWQFIDATETAGVAGTKTWATGVSMADVNGDGWLDIYVCNSGNPEGGDKENELFINQQDGTFHEEAAAYGLADGGFSTHAVFFDYDLDNDLDCYVLNNSFRPVNEFGLTNIREERDELGGDKLYRNDNGQFTDVSTETGIYGSVIGFGLGVTVGDVNVDGWPDIYVSNDFFERDYLYINRGDGTFSEELTERINHLSHFSMGADVGDLNNDGSPELFVTDMLPASQQRLKSLTKYDTYDFYQAKVQNGYHEQVMRNTLQLNNGDGTFREIGQYAGVHATDWSWGAVLTDFDNDGTMEIFVANGVYRDVTDQDFIDYLANEENMRQAIETGSVDFSKFVDQMPSQKIPNFLFHRGENMAYADSASAWGLADPSFSNGSAYGDLDNDGDLDLVVNNVNQELFLYRNNSETVRANNWLKVKAVGEGKNPFGIGASIAVYTPEGTFFRENMPMRGFQSSMDYGLTIGLGQSQSVDSVLVTWGPERRQTLTGVTVNTTLEVKQADASSQPPIGESGIQRRFVRQENLLHFEHSENAFVDWDRERMIYHMLSTEGPALAKGDVNGDGLEDVFLGGAVGQAGQVYLQQRDGSFAARLYQEDLTAAAGQEDIDAALFDADADGDLDLYVVRGGGQFVENHPSLQDGFYLNNGQGTFVASRTIPRYAQAGACVSPADYDGDGDIDLFVGIRHIPGKYGLAPGSHLLQNDGKGNFTDVGNTLMFGLESIGMITEAVWSDYDRDEDLDLMIVGEWMPLVIYKNTGQNFERLNNVPGLDKLNGWWNALTVTDLDGDGDEDYLLGNWGENTRYRAKKNEPLSLYIKDIDQNGTLDHIFSQYSNGKPYTIALKHDLEMQLNYMSKRFVYYKDFAGKSIDSVFNERELVDAIRQDVYTLQSVAVINNDDGSFQVTPLPEAVQYAPLFAITPIGWVGDEQHYLLGGNFDGVKPEEGGYAANPGLVLTYSDDDGFGVQFPQETGFDVSGEVRAIEIVDGKHIVVAQNDDAVVTFQYENE